MVPFSGKMNGTVTVGACSDCISNTLCTTAFVCFVLERSASDWVG